MSEPPNSLKPCPFCGWATPQILHVPADHDCADDFAIHCHECGALGGNRDTEALAIEAWNERSQS